MGFAELARLLRRISSPMKHIVGRICKATCRDGKQPVISWGFHGDFIGITDLNGSNGVYDTVSKLYDSTISGWWLTYPSEQK